VARSISYEARGLTVTLSPLSLICLLKDAVHCNACLLALLACVSEDNGIRCTAREWRGERERTESIVDFSHTSLSLLFGTHMRTHFHTHTHTDIHTYTHTHRQARRPTLPFQQLQGGEALLPTEGLHRHSSRPFS